MKTKIATLMTGIIIVVIGLSWCPVIAADNHAPATSQQQPSTQDQIKTIEAEIARATIIIAYLQQQRDAVQEYLVRLRDRRAELSAATTDKPKDAKGE